MYNIHLLPASFGDSILIEYGKVKKRYILIDGGPYFVFEDVMKALKRVAPGIKELELLVITHVDIDHIDGTIALLNQQALPFKIKEVWYNGFEEMKEAASDLLGVLQGEYVSQLLKMKKLPHNTKFANKAVMAPDKGPLPVIKLTGGMQLTLLAPTKQGLANMLAKWKEEVKEIGDAATVQKRLKEDTRYDIPINDLLGALKVEDLQKAVVKGDNSEANGSSIAFIGTFEGKSCLFAGDAFTDCLKPSVQKLLNASGKKRLPLNAWKIAHHGSKKSTLEELMSMIETKHILVSSDGKRYGHPDPETIAKLIKQEGPGVTFHFNYKTKLNDMWDSKTWQTKYNYIAKYPTVEGQDGISLSL